jgi:hypothetical protein
MVKLFVVLMIFVSGLSAGIVKDKVDNLLDKDTLTKHSKLVKRLFRKEGKFLINNKSIDFIKVLKVLKRNGLLKLFFNNRRDFSVTFNTSTAEHLFFMKIIINSLSKIGYEFIFTEYIKKTSDKMSWKISFNSEYTIDPLIFINELNKTGCIINDLSLDGTGSWIYNIDTSKSFLQNVKRVSVDNKVTLKDGKNDYMLSLKNGTEIVIRSSRLNNWYPNIVFFDNKLNILDNIREYKIVKKISLNIPTNTKYIKVSDMFTRKNISRGLKVTIK